MMSQKSKLVFIRLAYFLPALVGAVTLFLAFYPHLFFKSGETIYDSVSFFDFLENIRSTCFSAVSSASDATSAAVYFSYVMIPVWVLACLLAVWYAVFQIMTLFLSSVALTPRATSPLLNKLKRIYRIAVPCRGFYVFLLLIPLILSFLPYLFVALYENLLGMTAILYYDFLPDAVLLGILTFPCIALYLATLKAQKELKIDLFRLYKES